MSQWQTVRVFISSTFRDMHAERDHLVKVTFPALREQLEKYRIYLDDIDLRWGVTREQAENDQVLNLCLQEIDECRPFFIGILGERYGWVPTRYPADAVKKFGWIQHHTGKSVTELEILHGVLQDSKMRGRAFFYFRDPVAVSGVPKGVPRDVYAETDADLIRKLKNLKRQIRFSGYPVMDNYPARWDPDAYDRPSRSKGRLVGLEAFGERVHDQLWQAIKEEFQLPEQPNADAVADPLLEEQDDHERFMESRLRVYVGREQINDALLAFADGNDPVPCLVTGPSGSGKSAALARFVRDYKHKQPQTLVIPHFIGASPRSTNLRDMLRRFCLVFKARFGFAEDVPEEVAKLSVSFREFVGKVPADTRVLLVIDALNQMDEADCAQELYWLPTELPPQVKVIVSCITDSGKMEPVLEAFHSRAHCPVRLAALSETEQRDIIRQVPSLSAKTLDDEQVRLLLSNAATAKPLFLIVALEELRGFAPYERLNERIAAFPREGDTATAIFAQVIERLAEEFNQKLVETVLTLLASARRGLSERELQELIAGRDGADDLFPVLRQLRPYLLSRAGLIDFYHRNLLKAVRERFFSSEEQQRQAHVRLAEYFNVQDYWLESIDAQQRQAKTTPPTPRSANVRKLDELPWQLMHAGQPDDLYLLLQDRDTFLLLWNLSEFDVRMYWNVVLTQTPHSPLFTYRDILDSPETNIVLANAVARLLHAFSMENFAIPVWQRLIGDARRADDQKRLLTLLPCYADSLGRRGRLRAAYAAYRELHDIGIELRNPQSVTTAIAGIAAVDKQFARFDSAEERFYLARHLMERWGPVIEAQRSLLLLPDIYLRRGDPQRALDELKALQQECAMCSNMDDAVRAETNQAIAQIELGDFAAARQLLEKHVRWWRSVGSPFDLQNCLGNLANTYSHEGDLDRALHLHREEEKVCRQLGGVGLRVCLRNQARINLDQGNIDLAQRLFWEAWRTEWALVFSRSDLPWPLLHLLRGLSLLYRRREWKHWRDCL